MPPVIPFGTTGQSVSRLCFGTGSHGHPAVQAALPIDVLADLLVSAYQQGITFWDTALRYGTHPHVAAALRRIPRGDVVVTTKFHQPDRASAEASLARCFAELDTPYIDVVLMHEVDSVEELEARQPAWEVLREAQRQGRVRAIGLSTHSIDLLEVAAGQPDIQVLFTNLNYAHIHMDADLKHYLAALRRAWTCGQAVYVHKTLGEGALHGAVERAIHHNLALDCVHSVCVGMRNQAELDAALVAWRSFEGPPSTGRVDSEVETRSVAGADPT